MSFEMILQMISSYGFPIVACLVMGWYVKYQSDRNHSEVERLNEQHKEELKEITNAINNNTIALTKLCEKLED